jgi:hypothetical protein
MIDAGGPDHLSVGVRIPRGGFQRPISNRYLYVIPPGKVLCCLVFFLGCYFHNIQISGKFY